MKITFLNNMVPNIRPFTFWKGTKKCYTENLNCNLFCSTLCQMQSCLSVDQGCLINNLWCPMNQLLSIYFPLLVTTNTPDERGQLLPLACHRDEIWSGKRKQKKTKKLEKKTYFFWCYDTDLPAQVSWLNMYQSKENL